MGTCPECDGAGSLVLVGRNGQQVYRESYLCTLCDGSGMANRKLSTTAHKTPVDGAKEFVIR